MNWWSMARGGWFEFFPRFKDRVLKRHMGHIFVSFGFHNCIGVIIIAVIGHVTVPSIASSEVLTIFLTVMYGVQTTKVR